MDPERRYPAIVDFVPRVVALVLFGIFFQSSLVALVATIPKRIFFETSFSIALAQRSPLALVLFLAAAVLVGWLLSPWSRGQFSWSQIDRVGGLKWPIFVVAMALAWAYSGYGYNYYFDQAHVLDRLLIVALMFATLRSPLLIPLFAFEVMLARTQFDHPLSDLIPIGDQLPLRVFGIVAGAALWNGLLAYLPTFARLRSDPIRKRAESWTGWARVETHTLIYAILCTIAFYYVVAAIGKLMLGDGLLDWVRFSHMENLFVASHLNGWFQFISEERILELAALIRTLHFPITISTISIELGMAFILFRQRGSLLILAAVVMMHFGILVTSGIIFWKWLVIDMAFLIWLWTRREHEEIERVYSPSKGVASMVVIGGMIVVFSMNPFSWWNTKWTMIYEVEVVDEAGEVYVVNHADFSPYTFFDPYKPEDRKKHTYVFGSSLNQRVMEYFETSNALTLEIFGRSTPGLEVGAQVARSARVFEDFMKRYFRNRNEHPARSVPPFLFPSPSLHNRHLRAPNLYEDQGRVVEVRLRFKEFHYTGDELMRLRDEIVFSFPIGPAIEERPKR